MKVTGKIKASPTGSLYIDITSSKNNGTFEGWLIKLGKDAELIIDVVTVEQALLEAKAAKTKEIEAAQHWQKGTERTLLEGGEK